MSREWRLIVSEAGASEFYKSHGDHERISGAIAGGGTPPIWSINFSERLYTPSIPT